MRETKSADEFDTLSAVWIMANRDEKPIMFYDDVADRLGRTGKDVKELKKLVSGRRELFRQGVPEDRLDRWREWRRKKNEREVPPWLKNRAKDEGKTIEEVINGMSHRPKVDVFRSQFRSVTTQMYAVPNDSKAEKTPTEVIEWGLQYLDRRRKALLEASDVTIKRRHIMIVAGVGIFNIIVLIANLIVTVSLK